MAVQVMSSRKACVTCEYWQGPRKPDLSRRNVEMDVSAVAPCIERREKKKADANCSRWTKWGVLK